LEECGGAVRHDGLLTLERTESWAASAECGRAAANVRDEPMTTVKKTNTTAWEKMPSMAPASHTITVPMTRKKKSVADRACARPR
jgi:hypothetical protein